jgi:hypothetical protein
MRAVGSGSSGGHEASLSARVPPPLTKEEVWLLSKEWSPHVTLGKIGASRGQIGHLSLDTLNAKKTVEVQCRGIGMGGAAPKKRWVDWDRFVWVDGR